MSLYSHWYRSLVRTGQTDICKDSSHIFNSTILIDIPRLRNPNLGARLPALWLSQSSRLLLCSNCRPHLVIVSQEVLFGCVSYGFLSYD